jgi:hypothetical protein
MGHIEGGILKKEILNGGTSQYGLFPQKAKSIRYRTVPYGTVPCARMVPYRTVPYGTTWRWRRVQVPYRTVLYSTVRYGMVMYCTVQYRTVKYGTVRRVRYRTVPVPYLNTARFRFPVRYHTIANLICSSGSFACEPSVLSIRNSISRTERYNNVVRILRPFNLS